MAEVETPIPVFTGQDGTEYAVISSEDHTLADIARWLMTNRTDAEEVHRMLGDMLAATERV